MDQLYIAMLIILSVLLIIFLKKKRKYITIEEAAKILDKFIYIPNDTFVMYLQTFNVTENISSLDDRDMAFTYIVLDICKKYTLNCPFYSEILIRDEHYDFSNRKNVYIFRTHVFIKKKKFKELIKEIDIRIILSDRLSKV